MTGHRRTALKIQPADLQLHTAPFAWWKSNSDPTIWPVQQKIIPRDEHGLRLYHFVKIFSFCVRYNFIFLACTVTVQRNCFEPFSPNRQHLDLLSSSMSASCPVFRLFLSLSGAAEPVTRGLSVPGIYSSLVSTLLLSVYFEAFFFLDDLGSFSFRLEEEVS